MAKKSEKIKPGWYLPLSVRDKFTDFCSDQGTVIQQDFAGALVVWCNLPAELRELAKLEAKGLREPDPAFWEDFAAGLRLGIHAQRASQQEKQAK